MFKNYLKIAFRNLIKNKVYSIINILGLSVGLACSILLFMHVRDEFSYDTFYQHEDQLYRMALERVYPDHRSFYAIIPSGFSEVVQRDLPEVQEATRLVGFPNFTNIVRYEDRSFEEQYVFFADSNFFDVFPSFKLLQGDRDAALSQPNTIILTQSTAKKYFGNENPMGKSIKINGEPNEVVGVMQDVPEHSHMKFDFLSSTTNLQFLQQPNYISFSSYTYLRLQQGVDPAEVETKISPVVERYASGQIERNLGVSYKQYTEAGNGYHYFLQPISSIHLHSNLENEIRPNGNITYIYIFISIGLFILLIAGINFVNLATARSAERAKEVGVRKVMGSGRPQLIGQFLTESMVISLGSLLIALGLIQLVLPFFNNLAGKQLELQFFGDPVMLITLVGTASLVGFLAGLYPAFYISGLNSIEVMKGKFRSNQKGLWLRNGLVVFQFAISIALIAGTFVVYNQMDYIRNKSLGFHKENVLVVDRVGALESVDTFKQKVESLSGVSVVGGASTMPGTQNFFGAQFTKPGEADVLTTKSFSVDDDYLSAMGISMVAGRGFSEERDDSLNLILNEAAVRAFGLEHPIGAHLSSTNRVNNEQVTSDFTVIGVVDNFNFESLHTAVTPLAVFSSESSVGFVGSLAVRLKPGDMSHTLKQVEASWKQFAPAEPFLYSFLDNSLAALYHSERDSGKLLSVFAAIAIIIASVGLFGLAAYMAYQRTKEIGVRKVMGATVPNIVLLLSKDFAKLVIVAFVLAAPLAYLAMGQWLQNFAYRIDLSVITFLAAGIITLVIACLTVSYQAISAALVNPINSLRDE